MNRFLSLSTAAMFAVIAMFVTSSVANAQTIRWDFATNDILAETVIDDDGSIIKVQGRRHSWRRSNRGGRHSWRRSGGGRHSWRRSDRRRHSWRRSNRGGRHSWRRSDRRRHNWRRSRWY